MGKRSKNEQKNDWNETLIKFKVWNQVSCVRYNEKGKRLINNNASVMGSHRDN